MVWARIPPNRLDSLPLFGIEVIGPDDERPHLVWMEGPSGKMCVNTRSPRIWFESVSDAHQAGATAIQIGSPEEDEEMERFQERLRAAEEPEAPD